MEKYLTSRIGWFLLFVFAIIGVSATLPKAQAGCDPRTGFVCCGDPSTLNERLECEYSYGCVPPSACTGGRRLCIWNYRKGIWECRYCSRYVASGDLCGGGDGGGGGGGGDVRTCWKRCDGALAPACLLSVEAVGSTSVDLAWERRGDGGIATLYVCRNDGSGICDVRTVVPYQGQQNHTYTATGLQPSTPYYAVIGTDGTGIGACDAQGITVIWSNKVYFTTTGGPPTCDLSDFPSTITYDGKAFYDLTTGLVTTQAPTTHTAAIQVSDPDGDSVTVTSLSVNKPACLQTSYSGTTAQLTPQGAVTGQAFPPLDGPNACQVCVRAEVEDSGRVSLPASALGRPAGSPLPAFRQLPTSRTPTPSPLGPPFPS